MNNAHDILLNQPRTTSSGFTPPRAGQRGVYHNIDGLEIGFTVVRSEGNLCWARYDTEPNETTPFIYKFKVGSGDWEMNRLHDWPGKRIAISAAVEMMNQ